MKVVYITSTLKTMLVKYKLSIFRLVIISLKTLKTMLVKYKFRIRLLALKTM